MRIQILALQFHGEYDWGTLFHVFRVSTVLFFVVNFSHQNILAHFSFVLFDEVVDRD